MKVKSSREGNESQFSTSIPYAARLCSHRNFSALSLPLPVITASLRHHRASLRHCRASLRHCRGSGNLLAFLNASKPLWETASAVTQALLRVSVRVSEISLFQFSTLNFQLNSPLSTLPYLFLSSSLQGDS